MSVCIQRLGHPPKSPRNKRGKTMFDVVNSMGSVVVTGSHANCVGHINSLLNRQVAATLKIVESKDGKDSFRYAQHN